MNTDSTSGDEPADDPEEPESESLDDESGHDIELARPVLELGRQAAEAMRPVQDMLASQSRTYELALEALNSSSMRAAMDAATQQPKYIQDIISSPAMRAVTQATAPTQRLIQQLANSPAARLAAELSDTWRRIQSHTTDRINDTFQAVQSINKQIGPWITKVANTVGKTIEAVYRQAAPPNWTSDDTTSSVSYTAAVALALEEGIPLAWVPDHDTVRMLLAVPAGPDRRTALRAILGDRSTAILDHCQARLDELARHPNAPADRLRMIEVAGQSIQALRADLPAPAQSSAANLADHLLRRLFVPLDGKYVYKTTSERVTSLSEQVSTLSLSFLAILREFATLMPVPKSLTEWWPNKNMPLPDTFSRHATSHAIAEPDQVNSVNALIAVMLAVSLLCQEIASGWTALGMFVWSVDDDESDEDTSSPATQ